MELSVTDVLNGLGSAFLKFLDWRMVAILFGSTLLGTVVGALPGLTATMAVSLLVGLTFNLSTDVALLVLMAVYVSAIYGGSQAGVLINVPGTPSAAATTLDGHPLAKRGQAGLAIGVATVSSFLGTLFGAMVVLAVTPVLSAVALKFGAPEFFLLAVFGILISGNLTADHPLKGWIIGFVGLFISSIGLEEINGFPRFAYGSVELTGGISLIPAMVGLFGLGEVLTVLADPKKHQVVGRVGRVWPPLKLVGQYLPVTLRSGVIGVLIGAIPGVGEDVAAWVSYDVAKRTSRHRDEFGNGCLEGVVAAETANNACIGGALVPLLSLAIPGSAVAAVVLGAIWLHGVRPGPLLFFEFPTFFLEMVAMLVMSAFAMLFVGIGVANLSVRLLQVSKGVLMPVVAALCVIGAYAVNVRFFDIYVMVVFGVIGYLMRRYGYPVAPMTLGIILGPMADANLRRALIISNGSVLPFVTRPISLILLGIIAAMVLINVRRWAHRGAKVEELSGSPT